MSFSDQELMDIDLYTIEGIEYRNIILKRCRLNGLIPICNLYDIKYYDLIASIQDELSYIPFTHKLKIIDSFKQVIRN